MRERNTFLTIDACWSLQIFGNYFKVLQNPKGHSFLQFKTKNYPRVKLQAVI